MPLRLTAACATRLRDRLIFPVTQPDGRIDAFIGRDLSGRPQAPKYRNPTRTATYDKSTFLYHPVPSALDADGTLVVVEGVLDALAVTGAAANCGKTHRFAACSTSGLSVSAEQARQVATSSPGPPVIALDGDPAGGQATLRWLEGICLDGRRPALVTRLPEGLDPAEWLHRFGYAGLPAFDRHQALAGGAVIHPFLPGRALATLSLGRHRGDVAAVAADLRGLADQLPPEQATELLDQATAEVTRHGWNGADAFTRALNARRQTRECSDDKPDRPTALQRAPGRHSVASASLVPQPHPVAGPSLT